MLKVRFQVFSFASKKVQGFSSDMKTLMSLSSLLLQLQNHVSVFWNFNFGQYICRETFLMSLKSTSFPKGTLIKAFYLPRKTIWKKSETKICRRKTAEDNNANINVPPNIPCTFLYFFFFKVSAFLQNFFPEKSKFWEDQFFSVVNVWHSFPF